jgi:uncharacterized membrane protein
MALKPFLLAAPRWILVASISALLFLLGNVEGMVKFHSEEMTEFRSSMKEFAHTVADHGNAVRELAYQVRQLGNKVVIAARENDK